MRARRTLLALVVAAAAGCASFPASSYVDRSVDFSRYRTFDWGPRDSLPLGDPRLDENRYFRDQFEGAVERAFAAHGYSQPALGRRPDLAIHYHASVSRRIQADRADHAYGYRIDPQAHISEHEESTLVLDIVDTRTQTVIWRGWARADLRALLDNGQPVAKRIDEAVRRMLEELPRAGTRTAPGGRR